MSARYCYWSVATGRFAGLMERCVTSARRCGVFKEFHVLTDRSIESCLCYDAQSLDMSDGLFKLIYLKAGISKLLFDYLIWIDADSVFVRNPRKVLNCLRKSPIHVPLVTNLSQLDGEVMLPSNLKFEKSKTVSEHSDSASPSYRVGPSLSDSTGAACQDQVAQPTIRDYRELMRTAGVYNPVYLSGSAFWIVRRDAIDRICELAMHFRAFSKKHGYVAEVSACLGYAMQMLCANPDAHTLREFPDVWASDDQGRIQGTFPSNKGWSIEDPLTKDSFEVNPSIVHLRADKLRGDLCEAIGDPEEKYS